MSWRRAGHPGWLRAAWGTDVVSSLSLAQGSPGAGARGRGCFRGPRAQSEGRDVGVRAEGHVGGGQCWLGRDFLSWRMRDGATGGADRVLGPRGSGWETSPGKSTLSTTLRAERGQRSRSSSDKLMGHTLPVGAAAPADGARDRSRLSGWDPILSPAGGEAAHTSSWETGPRPGAAGLSRRDGMDLPVTSSRPLRHPRPHGRVPF